MQFKGIGDWRILLRDAVASYLPRSCSLAIKR